jgi:hypothetical protein
MLQPLIHYGIHLGLPLVVALTFFKKQWKVATLIMLAGLFIDIDHLIAYPIFDANRCSINFHPLHTYYAMIIYLLLLIPKKTRIIGLGLCIHILADLADCSLM